MSETSRKFSRNSVHKWLKLWKRVLWCCMLLPLMWNHSKTSVFRVTRPLHVGRLQQTAPTHQELHKSSRFEHLHFFAIAGSCAQKWHKSTQTHAQFSCLCCLTDDDFLTKDWIIFLNCNMCLCMYLTAPSTRTFGNATPPNPFHLIATWFFFATWPCHGAPWFCPLATKKGCLTATWFCPSTTWFAWLQSGSVQ